ncbi:MAG: hypothetical protein E2598_06455 [Sphingobium sp.]|nr:hypothetical protein [Sphingobium sp.]
MTLLTPLMTLQQPATGRPRRYIMPTAQGDGTGRNWANAAGISSLNAQIALARQAGGDVWVRADAGNYPETTISITEGGSPINRVNIIGVLVDGTPAHAPFVGTRTAPWAVGGSGGNAGGTFWLNAGADYLGFKFFAPKNCGLGFFRIRQPVTDLLIEDVDAVNVRSLVLNNIGGGIYSHASLNGGTFRRLTLRGHSKQGMYFRYDSHDILIEDVWLDSERQEDGSNPWATGVMFNDTAHDVVARRVKSYNTYHNIPDGYWNADGFSTERKNYNFLFEDCESGGHTDGGVDFKSTSTVLVRFKSFDNKRNYRLWGEVTLIDCIGLNPFRRGGTGNTCQVGAYRGSFIRVVRGRWEQTGAFVPFYAEETGFLSITQSAIDATVKPVDVAMTQIVGEDAQLEIYADDDFAAPRLLGSATGNVNENAIGNFKIETDRPAYVEVDRTIGDQAEFTTFGKQLDTKAQDYEAPLHPDNLIKAQFRLRGGNNVRSIPYWFHVTINDVEDDPIDQAETATYARNGCWFRAHPSLVWADLEMTIPAQIGDPVMALTDTSGFGNHARQPDIARCAIFGGDGAWRYWLDLDGSKYYEIGDPGEFRFEQVTAFAVYKRAEDSDSRAYLFSFPRSGSADTAFNAAWGLGVISTTTLWGRVGSNNATSPSGGAPKTRWNVSSLRTSDGQMRSNNILYTSAPGVETLSYQTNVATRKARLFADGDTNIGGFFSGLWSEGGIYDGDFSNDIRFRVERQMAQSGGINLV